MESSQPQPPEGVGPPPTPLPDIGAHIDPNGKGTPNDPDNPHARPNPPQMEYEAPVESVYLTELHELRAMMRKQQMVLIYIGAIGVCLIAFYVFRNLPVRDIPASVPEAE